MKLLFLITRFIGRDVHGGESNIRSVAWIRTGSHPCPDVSVIAGLMITLLLSTSGVTLAQTVDTTLWITNGPVYSIVPDGNTIYIGGRFSHVGPATGSGVAVDASTGAVQQPYPKVAGTVRAVAPDGSGGWYLGGVFTAVRGQPRNNLAHLDASGRLTAWNPSANGEVDALAVSGGTVYAGGGFSSIGGQPRYRIAALDAASGTATAWDPNASGGNTWIRVLVVSGGTVYAGGVFTSIGGQLRNNIAALDAATGAATIWTPNSNGTVYTLAVSGGTVYIGGAFTSIGAQPRNSIAALDAVTGALTSWDPNAGSVGKVYALAVSGGTVYVGGSFINIGGEPRDNIAALDVVSGAATAWDPDAGENSPYIGVDMVSALVVSGGTVYAGGRFADIGGQLRNHIAALDATTGAATAWEPNASSNVYALAVSGGTVYVGGNFASMGGAKRDHIAALDAASGAATSWDPHPTGGTDQGGHDIPLLYGVNALAVSGGTVYAGGHFTGIGGAPRYKIAALNASTGAATSWISGVVGSYPARHDPFITTLAVSGGTVYAGGAIITHMGGQPRKGLAALDAVTGAATAWNPNPNPDSWGSQTFHEVVVSGSTVYVAGGFTSIGGQPRNYVAALDATTGAATAWDPNPNASTPPGTIIVPSVVDAFAISGSTVYVGGTFTIIGGQPRNWIAALDATTGAATAWNPGAGGGDGTNIRKVEALVISGGTVYAGGNFTYMGGQPRNYISALDAATGAALAWDPNANRPVHALAVSGGKVYVGGEFTTIGGQPQFYLAAISSAPAPPVSVSHRETPLQSDLAHLSPNPTSGGTQVQYGVARQGRVRLEVLDVSGRVEETLADRIHTPGRYVVNWDGAGRRGRLSPGLHFVRLVAPDGVTVRKLAIIQ